MTIRHTEDQRSGTSARHDAAKASARPVLNRLLASKRGNVLPILAASILPMAAMIGGAVDMSRAYMVKSRLQHACDAGVLAGRRAMAAASYTDAAKAQARDFFDVNYQPGYNDTTDVTFSTTNVSGTSQVTGTASAVMPTTIMGMFGKETIDIDVKCQAELNLTNTDTTFVLDVTGSMLDTIPDGSGGSIVKITALRNSVMSFYDTLANASSGSNARIRYSFVPYSTNVNVGELLYDANQQWLIGGTTGDTWAYQSRRPIWNISTTTNSVDCQVYGGNQSFACPNRPHSAVSGGGTNISRTNCGNYGNNVGWLFGFSPNPTNNPSTQTSGNVTTRITYTAYSWGGAAPSWSGTNNRQCVRQRNIETTTVTQSATWQAGATFSHWEYGQYSFPVRAFVQSIKSANPAVTTPSEINGSTSRWNGCIEERDTLAAANFVSTSSGITADGSLNAHDLNIDARPTALRRNGAPIGRTSISSATTAPASRIMAVAIPPVPARRRCSPR